MLWKLLKYDFRSMWKQFSIIWPAALVIGLIDRFTLTGQASTSFVGETAALISVILLFGVMCAMFVVSMVFVLTRFYRGLLGNEGYLMHTLPVHAWQLVLSKLICAIAVSILNCVVAVLALLVMVPWRLTELFRWEFVTFIFTGFAKHPDTLLYITEFCIQTAAGLAVIITMAYLSMAVGHLFSKHRVLMSVVAFFVIDIIGNVAVSVLSEIGLFRIFKILDSSHAALWAATAMCLIPAAIMFLGTSWILKHKLDLE